MGEWHGPQEEQLGYHLTRATGWSWIVIRYGNLLSGHWTLVMRGHIDRRNPGAWECGQGQSEMVAFAEQVRCIALQADPSRKCVIIMDADGGVGAPRYGVDYSGRPIVGKIGTPPTKWHLL